MRELDNSSAAQTSAATNHGSPLILTIRTFASSNLMTEISSLLFSG
jgi:hypothetical protein